jgi:hypothetical protein
MTQTAKKRRVAFWGIMAAVLMTAMAGALVLLALAASPNAGDTQVGPRLGPRLPLLLIAAGALGVVGLVLLLRAINRAMAHRLRPPP